MSAPIDFIVTHHGSIVLLHPHTPAAVRWIGEHLPEDAQTLGNAVAVEPRYITPIVDGIRDDGLLVA